MAQASVPPHTHSLSLSPHTLSPHSFTPHTPHIHTPHTHTPHPTLTPHNHTHTPHTPHSHPTLTPHTHAPITPHTHTPMSPMSPMCHHPMLPPPPPISRPSFRTCSSIPDAALPIFELPHSSVTCFVPFFGHCHKNVTSSHTYPTPMPPPPNPTPTPPPPVAWEHSQANPTSDSTIQVGDTIVEARVGQTAISLER